MSDEAKVPSGFWARVREICRDEIAKFAQSGFLRNSTISGGAGLRIIDGGSLSLVSVSGVELFYIGPVQPNRADGTPQQGLIIRRDDGTTAVLMRDQFPTDDGGALNQAFNFFDRAGNVWLADDTNSGQGMARPWLSGGFARARYADMTVSTTSSTFETLFDQRISKQQPRLEVCYRATMDAASTTGETRVLVNGVQLGAVAAETFAIATRYAGPAAVAGANMSDLLVEVQGRRTSASGALRVEPLYWKGRQS